MKNVLFDFPYKKSYYILHPLKFLYELKVNLCNAWNRATKGYCYIDVANFDSWFLEIAPEMLQELSNGHSYPDIDEFDTYEKWQSWLREQANNLIACREENVADKNEYKDDFYRYTETIHTQRNENGFTEIKFDDSPEAIAARDKYFAREAELYKERKNRMQTTLTELSRNWFHLWN